MKNKLTDLNDHLFAQLERLGDEELNEDELAKEIKRAKSITDVSKEIVSNGRLSLEVAKTRQEYNGYDIGMPKMLGERE